MKAGCRHFGVVYFFLLVTHTITSEPKYMYRYIAEIIYGKRKCFACVG